MKDRKYVEEHKSWALFGGGKQKTGMLNIV